jgi:hypothetical protein
MIDEYRCGGRNEGESNHNYDDMTTVGLMAVGVWRNERSSGDVLIS